jgi:hypothetical protein
VFSRILQTKLMDLPEPLTNGEIDLDENLLSSLVFLAEIYQKSLSIES